MEPATAITRRRALALGMAAGMAALLRPRLPAALAAARSGIGATFDLEVGPGAFSDGVTGVVRARRRFQLLGVRGRELPAGLEVRARRRGSEWSAWAPVAGGAGHEPDGVGGGADTVSDPVWTGSADEVQLRCEGTVPGRLRLHFVTVPAVRAGRRAAARAAQSLPGQAPTIIPRSEWGGDRLPPRVAPSYGNVEVAFVHHTVTANDYRPQDSARMVFGICRYHRDVKGWHDIGYNFLVDRYGQVFEGRAGGADLPVVGAQAQGYNRLSTGIASLGTFDRLRQTNAGLDALATLIAWKLTLHGVPIQGTVRVLSGGGATNRYPYGTEVTLARVCGHRDACSTDCPGGALYSQVPEIRRRAAALAGPLAPPPQLSLGAGAAVVPFGATVPLEGRLTLGDGSPGAVLPVSVQKLGSQGFVPIAHVTTGDDGVWSADVLWSRDGAVRALARQRDGRIAVSPVRRVGVLPLLRASTPARHVRAGGVAVVEGTIRPVVPVRVVVERQGPDRRWRRLAVTTIAPRRSRFAGAVRLRHPGLYRLTAQAGTGRGGVSAPPILVRAVRHLRPTA